MRWFEIATIWRRELLKFFADPGLIITSIIVPLSSIIILGFGLNQFVQIPGLEIDYLDYFGPGAIAVLSIGAAMFVGFSIIRDKQGYIKELLVVPISRYSILIGKILSEITTQILTLIASVAVIVLFVLKTDRGWEGIGWTIFFMFLIVFGFSGFGIVVSSVFRHAKSYNQIMVIIILPIAFLSGAFFPIEGLPSVMKYIAYCNPLTYGVDGIRWSLIGVSNLPILFNTFILFVFTIAMMVIGAKLFEKGFKG